MASNTIHSSKNKAAMLPLRSIRWFFIFMTLVGIFSIIQTVSIANYLFFHQINGEETSGSITHAPPNQNISTKLQQNHNPSAPLHKNKTTNNKKIEPQWAIIHVGPHKMASTSIQKSIVKNEKLLNDDNYDILHHTDSPGRHPGAKAGANLALCLSPSNVEDYPCAPDFWHNVTSFVDRTAAAGRNVLISSEEFDRVDIDVTKLKELLRPWRYARIVVVYRRFYEWLPSLYYQIHRDDTKGRSGRKRTNATTTTTAAAAAADGSFPSLVDWITNETNILKYKTEMYTTAVAERYRAAFSDVSILNMHQSSSTDIVSQFYCEFVTNATHACAAAKKRAMLPSAGGVENVGRTLDILRLVNVAIERGLVKDGVTEGQLAETVRYRSDMMIKKGLGFPTRCVADDVLRLLFNITVESEEEHFPSWWSSTNSNDRVTNQWLAFKSFAASSLCCIDVDAVLDDRYWRLVFGSVRPR